MKILTQEHPLFWHYVRFLQSSSGYHSAQYSELNYKYYIQRPLDNGSSASPASFVIIRNEVPVLAFIGAIMTNPEGRRELSFGELPCTVIEGGVEPSNKEIGEFIVKINSLECDAVRIYDYISMGHFSFYTREVISNREGGYEILEYPLVPLEKDGSILFSKIRKSYKSLLNWGERELVVKKINGKNVKWKHFEDFMRMHIDVSGRQTRSEETWKLQYEMVQKEEAFLLIGSLNSKAISYGFFPYNFKSCYYGNSVSLREYFDKPIFHRLLWEAILYAKELGCEYFDISPMSYDDEKLSDIAKFKTGFGADIHLVARVTGSGTRDRV
ncbi:hypothetical protein EHO61_12670 [Leptospira fluminis]|uniref:Uncharacterized protein n=1 Tax=Leptospira fluminis TaxID=2484979 RepID=A0A4R9GM54_9LEPT|nr:hypothetical protein [Leptospira fluminis]TGK17260.1 hypothetical protein EHO61_12670 [Leptospira fluminis]